MRNVDTFLKLGVISASSTIDAWPYIATKTSTERPLVICYILEKPVIS